MPTKNPRINVTFEDATVELLSKIALQESKSLSSLAKELVLEALDRREDAVLSAIAHVRDIKKAKKVAHKDAWK